MPSVSVVLTNYNGAGFLRASIDGVLSQSLDDLELIVVDDGSTDESRAIIQRYRDPRLIALFQENGGQGSALMTGIGRATGEYVAFLDADDVWHPNKLERCMSILEGDSGISLIAHGFDVIDAEGQFVRRGQVYERAGAFDQWAAYRNLEMDLPYVPTSFLMSGRRYVARVRFRPEEWRIAADTPLIAGLSVMGKVYLLADVLGGYRHHEANHFEGRQTGASLVALRTRFYRSLNEHLAADGKATRYRFERSAAFLAQRVLQTDKWSWSGVMARCRYQAVRRRQQWRVGRA